MLPARDIVLLLTHRGDHYTVDRVGQELSRRGALPLRIDTDSFPSELQLTTSLGPERSQAVLRAAGHEISADQIQAVWLRRMVPPRLDEDLEPAWREGCLRESHAALEGFLGELHASGCRFINPLLAGHSATQKLRQLRLARALGLEVPRTLVTNDAAQVRAFFQQVHHRMVAKMLTPLSQSMDGALPFVYTSAVSPEHLEQLDGLRYSPMVFQERIDKARELRVVIVGQRCLVGAMELSGSEAGRVDWRRASPQECRWVPGELPAQVATRLVRLVAELGLVYGAADVIVTPDGRHLFLEVNPGGEWGMLERELGLPIAAALAESLLSEDSSHQYPAQESP